MIKTAAEFDAKKTAVQNTIAIFVGVPVELTIRGDRDFTLSANGNVDMKPAVRFLKADKSIKVTTSSRYDAAADLTCLYFSVK